MITYDSIAAMKLNRYVFDLNTKLNNINKQIKTGSTVNQGSDAPALFNFTAHVKGYSKFYNTANQNATDGIAMVDTGKNALSTIQDKLSQIEDILKEAKKTSVSGDKREEMQAKIDKLVKEIYEIKQNTGYNGYQIFGAPDTTGAGAVTPGTPEGETGNELQHITPVIPKTDAELEAEGYIVIKSAEEFYQAISDDPWSDIALGCDIDFSGFDYMPYDDGNAFEAVFDGNGYKIKNLTIDNASEYTGLFGALDAATIQNVVLENVNIKGTRFVGALAGKAYDSTITNSYVIGGTVEGKSLVGGLIGQADSSEITTSYVELDLVKSESGDTGGFAGSLLKTNVSQSYAIADVETVLRGGVFSGLNNYSTIENSFAIGSISGDDTIGGFSGANGGTTITDSYASAEVTGNVSVGGFIGMLSGNTASNIVENSFFDFEVARTNTAVGSYFSSDASQVTTLNGISTSQMTTPATFTNAGWDTDVWYLKSGKTPHLRDISDSPFPEKENEPEYLGRLEAVKGPIRIQTGNDNTTNSYVMVDTRFKFDNSFNFHADSVEFAEKSLENVEIVKQQLLNKTNELNVSRKILESQADATYSKSKNGNDVFQALAGVDSDAIIAEKNKLLSDLANAKALRDSSRALNAEVCKTLVLGAIYGKSYAPFSAISNMMN